MSHQYQVDRINKRLTKVFNPEKLLVTDESQHHITHPEAQSGKGHFLVEITSAVFRNKNLVECHQLIYEALGDLIKTDIHALQIRTATPDSL